MQPVARMTDKLLNAFAAPVEFAWQPGQASALEHWEVAKGRDVGTVTASIKDADGKRHDVPYDVTFALWSTRSTQTHSFSSN